MGDRCHVTIRYQVASGTAATDCHLYGYITDAGWWAYLGSINSGGSIAASTPWNESATAIAIHEHFPIAMGQVSRLMTRVINPQGNTPVITTYIGYERA